MKLVIENWPAGTVEEMEAVNNPEDPSAGSRKVPFTGELYIEQDDFREVPPPKYYRLYPGNQVRLRYALHRHLHRRAQGPVNGRSHARYAARMTPPRAAATRRTTAR